MKKLDKLIVTSFFGPFFMTFFIVVFILLLQFLLKYFDELVGKGLGLNIYAQLLGYFSINMTPNAFPLAVLLSSLMTFGNLGEHSELTAIKSSGVSLLRTLFPIFIISIFLTVIAYFSNNYIVPKANLKAYSLLWDIKNKTPALNLKEGVFYGDIPGYQIKVAKKFSDGRSLKGIMIYDHTQGNGNKDVTLADSGQMYTILNSRYLVMDLYNGRMYSEESSPVHEQEHVGKPPPFSRSTFDHCRVIFSMASFDLKRTKEDLFKSNRVMKDVAELHHDVDSMQNEVRYTRYEAFYNLKQKFSLALDSLKIPASLNPKLYGFDKKNERPNPIQNAENKEEPVKTFSSNPERNKKFKEINSELREKAKEDRKHNFRSIAKLRPLPSELRRVDSAEIKRPDWAKVGADSILNGKFDNAKILNNAVTDARFIKNNFMMASSKVDNWIAEVKSFQVQRYKIFAQAFACIIMFIIGAPLGSIIKKGGLGFPVIVSIGFFIIYYVFMIMGEKWAKQELISPFIGVWLPNFVLIPIGILFLFQARRDARLFESDFYLVLFENLKVRIQAMRKKNA